MKLESLQLEKFKDCSLKRKQMFKLNGGGVESGPGNTCDFVKSVGKLMNFDYGYDSYRDGVTTYHNRSNMMDTCEQAGRE